MHPQGQPRQTSLVRLETSGLSDQIVMTRQIKSPLQWVGRGGESGRWGSTLAEAGYSTEVLKVYSHHTVTSRQSLAPGVPEEEVERLNAALA